MAWCFVCLVELIKIYFSTGVSIGNIGYVGYVPFFLHVLLILLLFVTEYIVFELLGNEYIEKACLFVVSFFYALVSVVENPDTYFCLGVAALMLFTVIYVCDRSITISKTAVNILLAAAGIVFVVFTGGCTALRVLTYSSPNFDLGLFSQMFHYMKTTFTMNTTSERDMLLSHMHILCSFFIACHAAGNAGGCHCAGHYSSCGNL
jgi:hypothetical protein